MILRFLGACVVAAVVGASAPAYAQQVPAPPQTLPSPLTLNEALNIALVHQPQRTIARTQITEAAGQKQEVQSQYYPTLTPSYSFQNRTNALYGVGTSTTQTGVGTGTGTTTTNQVNTVRGGGLSISLSQNLFDSGQRELANAQARRAVDIANYGDADTRQQIVQTVTQDYYSLLQAIDLVKVAQAQVDRYQQTLDLTKAQVTAGTAARKDTFQALADLATAQFTLEQDQNNVVTSSAALKNALGVETDDVVQPAPLASGSDLPPLPTNDQTLTLNQNIQEAYTNRPDLQAQLATVQSSNAAVKTAQINAGFSIGTTFALTYQATNDVGRRGLDTQLLLTGSYPLFDAGKARGAVRVARAQRDATEAVLVQRRQAIRQTVEQAYSTQATALVGANLAQAAVQAAQVNYDAAVASRREGVGTIIDVTTAQATLTQAQNQYVTAIYNYYIAQSALQRAVGRNDVGLPR